MARRQLLTDEERLALLGIPSDADSLARLFTLSRSDRSLVAERRGDSDQLGCAVQLALLDNLSKGRIDVGIGKGTVYNEYEFVGHGLRSTDSRERMEEAVDIIERAWREAPLSYDGRFHKVHIPAIRPKPVQQPGPPLWRSVISPAPSYTARTSESWASFAG